MPLEFSTPFDEVTAFRLQLAHLGGVYHAIVQSLADRQRLDAGDGPEATVWRELEDEYDAWESAEVLAISYVSMYHCWETQVVGLLQRQGRRQQIAGPRRKKREALPAYVRRWLRESFQADVAEDLLAPIDGVRRFCNGFKHGIDVSEGVDGGVARSERSRSSDCAGLLTPHAFLAFVSDLDRFWGGVPYKMQYRGSLGTA